MDVGEYRRLLAAPGILYSLEERQEDNRVVPKKNLLSIQLG